MSAGRLIRRMGAGAVALALLAGCGRQLTGSLSPALTKVYAETTLEALEAGFFKTDRDPADVPVTPGILTRNFERIAFYREADPFGDTASERLPAVRKPLSRWTEPVRWSVWQEDDAPIFTGAVAGFMDRMAAITGHDIAKAADAQDANFAIFLANADLRRAISLEGENNASERADEYGIRDFLKEDTFNVPCKGALGFDDSGAISGVLVLVRAEVTGIFRQSCIEEELTQSMGLMNDDSTVRPSLFNDDQEFALLTVHDELLLKALYDPRLRVGMEVEEARPIFGRIFKEISPKR